MAKLVVTIQGRTLREVVLPKGIALTIGRGSENMLVLENTAISRFHARVEQIGWPFYLEDLGSTNGTRLNGKKIANRASLKRNDKIGVGKFEIVFLDDPSDYDSRKGGDDGMTTIPVG